MLFSAVWLLLTLSLLCACYGSDQDFHISYVIEF